jgi:hypothetical protein
MEPDEFTEEEFELAVKVLERIAEKHYQEAVLQRKDTEEARDIRNGFRRLAGTVLEEKIGRGRRGA